MRSKRGINRVSVSVQALDASVETVQLRTSNGCTVRPLALERGAGGTAQDVLVVMCQHPNAADTEFLRLTRGEPNTWSSDQAVGVVLQASDQELARLLLGKNLRPLPEYAPCWPKKVFQQLDSWPLKGPGTIVFDGQYFLQRVAERVAPGKGMLLFPGAAAQMGLPSSNVESDLRDAMMPGRSLVAQLIGASDEPAGESEAARHVSYGDLLAVSEGIRTGVVDFSRGHVPAGPRRTAHLELQPFGGFGLEYVPRTWARGVVLRDLEPGGEAECAGCREGDAVVSADGRAFLEVPLSDVQALLAPVMPASQQITLEVEQPVLPEPFYIREASTALLRDLAGPSTEDAALKLVPQIKQLLAEERNYELHFEEDRPMVFAGDGGSASRIHADQQHRVQFCHLLHGAKFFALDTSGKLDTGDDAKSNGYNEVSLPVDLPLPPDKVAWLSRPEVSITVAHAGDIFCFWGGDRHCGANALSNGPSVALFHSCSKRPPQQEH